MATQRKGINYTRKSRTHKTSHKFSTKYQPKADTTYRKMTNDALIINMLKHLTTIKKFDPLWYKIISKKLAKLNERCKVGNNMLAYRLSLFLLNIAVTKNWEGMTKQEKLDISSTMDNIINKFFSMRYREELGTCLNAIINTIAYQGITMLAGGNGEHIMRSIDIIKSIEKNGTDTSFIILKEIIEIGGITSVFEAGKYIDNLDGDNLDYALTIQKAILELFGDEGNHVFATYGIDIINNIKKRSTGHNRLASLYACGDLIRSIPKTIEPEIKLNIVKNVIEKLSEKLFAPVMELGLLPLMKIKMEYEHVKWLEGILYEIPSSVVLHTLQLTHMMVVSRRFTKQTSEEIRKMVKRVSEAKENNIFVETFFSSLSTIMAIKEITNETLYYFLNKINETTSDPLDIIKKINTLKTKLIERNASDIKEINKNPQSLLAEVH